MVKVEYPDGHIVNFMWITEKYGYFRIKGKILRYNLPKIKIKQGGVFVVAHNNRTLQHDITKVEPITNR